MKKALVQLRELCSKSRPIVMLTAYDFPTAALEDAAGVDAILVGDSLGTNVLGYRSEREVTMDDMIHHVKAVGRGVKTAYLLADLPYLSYETSRQAIDNSKLLLAAGADGVKLEGPKLDIVRTLKAEGIEVCGHLGYTPQTAKAPGFKAKQASEALQLIDDAIALEEAGADWIVLETVPEEVAQLATERLSIPTIGIGAGRFVSGQVLVVPDVLGMTAMNFVHNRQFAKLREPVQKALSSYVEEVREKRFPAENNLRHLAETEKEALLRGLEERRRDFGI